jgi:hypothetical protein
LALDLGRESRLPPEPECNDRSCIATRADQPSLAWLWSVRTTEALSERLVSDTASTLLNDWPGRSAVRLIYASKWPTGERPVSVRDSAIGDVQRSARGTDPARFSEPPPSTTSTRPVRRFEPEEKTSFCDLGGVAHRRDAEPAQEAAAEIKPVKKSDPVAAGDGVVSLMERIWPAFQRIDASSFSRSFARQPTTARKSATIPPCANRPAKADSSGRRKERRGH